MISGRQGVNIKLEDQKLRGGGSMVLVEELRENGCNFMETLKFRRSLYTAEEEDLLQQGRGPSTGGIEDLLRGDDMYLDISQSQTE